MSSDKLEYKEDIQIPVPWGYISGIDYIIYIQLKV